jgi:hypothetical protein
VAPGKKRKNLHTIPLIYKPLAEAARLLEKCFKERIIRVNQNERAAPSKALVIRSPKEVDDFWAFLKTTLSKKKQDGETIPAKQRKALLSAIDDVDPEEQSMPAEDDLDKLLEDAMEE